MNYRVGKNALWYIHPERNALFIAFQIAEAKIPQIKSQLSEYALHVWDNRYLCRKGGWMWYRLTDTWQINDIRLLLNAKIKPKKQ
ncbi:MAG TPA: DUF3788 family protein [Acholeplasmataceae bacterium]|nr:DUF3788 family protein [Acholeplasmataceae bacterium]